MKPAISGRWAATARPLPLAAVVLLWSAAGSLAGEADVIAVTARPRAPGVYDFDVTVRSNDSGWDHYADRLEAVAPDGRILGTRGLLHRHDDEQPFTRDISGVRVPTLVGIPAPVGLALSLARRVRELLLGVPARLAWQLIEGRRLWTA